LGQVRLRRKTAQVASKLKLMRNGNDIKDRR
jgi:hypothetical protein